MSIIEAAKAELRRVDFEFGDADQSRRGIGGNGHMAFNEPGSAF